MELLAVEAQLIFVVGFELNAQDKGSVIRPRRSVNDLGKVRPDADH
jgi:hypothetical protein